MPDELSVRQWQEKFRAGAFSTPDRYTQCEAGWYDWFCRDEALAGRLKKIGRVVMGITDPFILDNYYVWFKNNCPASGPLYDDVRFEPLSGERGGQYFVVTLDSPHERAKWALTTERFGYEAPEFECGNIREMVRYINALGPELAKGIVPDFVREKDALAEHIAQCLGIKNIPIFRDGSHQFEYRLPRERGFKRAVVVSSPDDLPSDLPAEQMTVAGKFLIHAPDISGTAPAVQQNKEQRKEMAR